MADQFARALGLEPARRLPRAGRLSLAAPFGPRASPGRGRRARRVEGRLRLACRRGGRRDLDNPLLRSEPLLVPSPRHNLLPSIGWSVTVVSLGAYAVSRDRRTSAILPGLACLFFTVAAVSNFHEGTQWIDSRGLHDDFVSAVLRLSPPVDSVFLVGAPRYLRRAPAFNLRHDVITAAARALGRPLDNGDNEASPTRRGVVYYNDLTLLPAEYFRWIPATEVNLTSFDAANRAFTCVFSARGKSRWTKPGSASTAQ